MPTNSTSITLFIGLSLSVLLGAACSHSTLPGTSIKATPENQEIFDQVQALRLAMERKDTQAIIDMIALDYFEDMGTPDGADDYGYAEFTQDILPRSMAMTNEMYVTFTIHEIVVEDDNAIVDVRYRSRTQVQLPSGSLWDSHQDFNRIQMRRTDNTWKIVRGL